MSNIDINEVIFNGLVLTHVLCCRDLLVLKCWVVPKRALWFTIH